MNTYIKTLTRNISNLEPKDIKLFADRISDLLSLYQKLNSTISSSENLMHIKSTNQDLYELVLFFEKNKLWNELPALSNYFQNKFNTNTSITISSNDNDFLKSKISHIDSDIIELSTDKIGAYIKSKDKIFSRDIDKDIDKLIRS